MEYEWIFEEGVGYGYFFFRFCVLVAFYHAGDINGHLENELWVIQLISTIRKVDAVKVTSYKVYCLIINKLIQFCMQQTKKLKVAFFFLSFFFAFFLYSMLSNTLKRIGFLCQGITSFKIQKQVPLNLDEKSSRYDTVTINVMNKW